MGRRSGTETQAQEKRIVNRLPHYGRFDYARIGFFSLTTRDTKFISEDDAVTVSGETETPGYHFGKFMSGLWTAKRTNTDLNLSYPFKAVPGKYPNGIYVDIRHAFRQIARAFGMEVFVDEGRFVAYGETLPDVECFQNKICRGLLVTGVSRYGSYQEWINRDIRTVKFSNPNYAPHIAHAIWAVLHSVQSVLSPYTVYGHTDGFIVPKRHLPVVAETLDFYGFNYTIKGSGPCEVYGTGSYRVGETRTRLLVPSKGTRVYIREDNSKWWLDAFRKGVEFRNDWKPSLNADEGYS